MPLQIGKKIRKKGHQSMYLTDIGSSVVVCGGGGVQDRDTMN